MNFELNIDESKTTLLEKMGVTDAAAGKHLVEIGKMSIQLEDVPNHVKEITMFRYIANNCEGLEDVIVMAYLAGELNGACKQALEDQAEYKANIEKAIHTSEASAKLALNARTSLANAMKELELMKVKVHSMQSIINQQIK